MKFIQLGLLLALLSACGREDLYLVDQMRFRIDFDTRTLNADFEFASDLGVFSHASARFDELGQIEIEDRGERDHIQLDIALSSSTRAQAWPSLNYLKILNRQPLPRVFARSPLKIWARPETDGSLGLIFSQNDRVQFGMEWEDKIFSNLYKNYIGEQKFTDVGKTKTATILLLGPGDDHPGGLVILCDFGESPFDQESATEAEWILLPENSSSPNSWQYLSTAWVKKLAEKFREYL